MSAVESLLFGLGRSLPVMLQTEAAECGLTCLAMISTFHGHRIDTATLRRRHPASLRGLTLTTVIKIASTLKLGTRPVRLELQDLGKLRLPCILHWNMNHFVVLKEVRGNKFTIHGRCP
jgi:ATP-binding cassette, subfamily B, bacterial CvaB/MchF/RaxB